MPGEAKWAISPPISPSSPRRIAAYSLVKALLRHSTRRCGDNFFLPFFFFKNLHKVKKARKEEAVIGEEGETLTT